MRAALAATGWVALRWGPGFPWGTLIANVTGSFAIGLGAAWAGYAAAAALSRTV